MGTSVVEVGPNETIGSLKEQVAEILDIPNPKDIVLTKDGIALENNKTLSDYGIKDGDTVEVTTLAVQGSPLSFILSRRINKEKKIIRRNNLPIQFIDGIRWIAFVRARRGKWARKTYRVLIELPPNYPYSPPKARFLEKLDPPHPNISNETGRVCTNILNDKNWRPDFNLGTVYDVLRQVLEKPNYYDALPSYRRESKRELVNIPWPTVNFSSIINWHWREEDEF